MIGLKSYSVRPMVLSYTHIVGFRASGDPPGASQSPGAVTRYRNGLLFARTTSMILFNGTHFSLESR